MDNYKQQVAEHIEAVQAILADLSRLGTETLAEGQKLIAQAASHREAAETAKQALTDTKLAVAKETKEVQASIATLKQENQRLKDENNALVALKSDLTVQNVRLEQANKDFVAYEEKAWKVFDAKDKELVDREKNVSEKENMGSATRSFLPPRQ